MMEGTLEFLPGEKAEEVKVEFEKTITDTGNKDPWLKTHPPKIEWFGLNVLPAQTSPDHDLVKTFMNVYNEMSGKKGVVTGFPAACDMRIRALHAHTPSILFGPGELSLAHRADESIDIDELLLYVKTLALGILEWSKG
jgi:acetylornithine deacetylase